MVVAWLVVAAAAVTVGVLAVGTVGDTIRDRGPLGNETIRNAELEEGSGSPSPGAARVRDVVSGKYGEFVAECRGVYAFGLEANPREAAGWRTVSYEQGPDDDVDAVFANRGRSVDIEIFCNRGEPTVAEIEWHTLPDED